jgi:hypothetical protein
VTYLIEYLGEFEFIFEIILDYESGDQMGSFDAKKPPSKISCLGTFKWTVSVNGVSESRCKHTVNMLSGRWASISDIISDISDIRLLIN